MITDKMIYILYTIIDKKKLFETIFSSTSTKRINTCPFNKM